MGVDISDIVLKKPLLLSALSGRVIAVDALNIIYQFLASIRQEDGTPLMDFKGRITAHLSGLFYRNARLIENGIKPVFVFDGKAPAFKKKTHAERAQNKKEAEERWKKALEEERYEEAKKYAQATARVTEEMLDESKKLLDAMGIPWVQAPSEGEAQAAAMVIQGDAYAVGSQDYDALLFGAPILLRNISITGKRKVPRENRYINIEPEEINLQESLKAADITREKLILIGIMSGTDFNEGVPRVGPKTALKIVKEHGTLKEVEKYVKEKYNYEFEYDIEEVFRFFLNPPVVRAPTLKWGEVSEENIHDILVKEHDFNDERIRSTTEKITKAYQEKGAQSKLEKWF